MFIFLSKTLDWFLSPLSWSIVLLLVGLLLRKRSTYWAKLLALGAAVVLVVFSLPAVSSRLALWVESQASSTIQPGLQYDAVVVLGGGLDPIVTKRTGSPEYTAAGDRVLRGFQWVRTERARNILLAAGTLDPDPSAVVEAQVLANQLKEWGVEPQRIFVDGKSRNTRENAIESAKIVSAQKWKKIVLVTSAAHMPRALGCFYAVGLNPDSDPVDFREASSSWSLLPQAHRLQESAEMIRELAGRVIYRILGYSKN